LIDFDVEYKRIILYYYFLRVGFTKTFYTLLEFKVELNIFSLGKTSFYFINSVGALKEVPGRLCFIGILTILGFY
jgi:hypothetical protein